MHRTLLLAILLAAVSSPASAQQPAKTKATMGPAEIKVGGAVASPFTITAELMRSMPRKTLQVENPHTRKKEVYEGVPLAEILQKAGVPHGEALRGAALASYVVIDAADNYRVVFSTAELDSGFMDSDVLLADTMDGAPLGAGQGVFKIVVPHEKRPARWVEMVSAITVGRAE